MRRREFFPALGGTAAWPLVAGVSSRRKCEAPDQPPGLAELEHGRTIPFSDMGG